MSKKQKFIKTDIENGVGYAVLDRPEALNAISRELIEELARVLQGYDMDNEVRCIVITGSEKAFAAGADVKAMAEAGFAEMRSDPPFRPSAQIIDSIRKPIIGAVAGYALGGGCELALACDILIAADTAKFGLPEVNLGIMPGMGGTQRLIRAIGKSRAMEMALTGEFLSAEDAERYSLVSRVVHADELMSEVKALAEKIAEKPLMSVYSIKESVNAAENLPLNEGLRLELELFNALFSTEDQKEGMAAFIEKRSAKFHNK